jgi:hypothetical protein
LRSTANVNGTRHEHGSTVTLTDNNAFRQASIESRVKRLTNDGDPFASLTSSYAVVGNKRYPDIASDLVHLSSR